MDIQADGILSKLNGLEIFDTFENFKISAASDIITLLTPPHIRTLLFTSGMAEDNIQALSNNSISVLERWLLLEPFLPYVRHCYPLNICLEALSSIYNLELSKFTVDGVNSKLREADENNTRVASVMKKFNVVCVTPYRINRQNNALPAAFNMEHFISPENKSSAELLEKISGTANNCFDDWVQAVEISVSRLHEQNCCLRLTRPLEKVSKSSWAGMEDIYKNLMEGKNIDKTDFSSYMLAFAFDCARKLKMTVQLSRGLALEAMAAHEFFNYYREINFDCFSDDLELAGICPNFYINTGALAAKDPEWTYAFLTRAMNRIPVNKISLASGDFSAPEEAAGFYLSVRRLLARFFSERVRWDMNEKQYMYIAGLWLNGVAGGLYHRDYN
ncbi:MAG: hypothetical protein JXR78_11405 [Victivallales bacterium]|nr:hypothetical protein [Victivallales bacterium]